MNGSQARSLKRAGMDTVYLLYHLARADFLERTRRYSFLVMLGLVLYLGYSVNTGQITLRLDAYRGVFNSAWIGSMMTLVVNFFLGWFGFYLVKNAIARDYETGVGQIIAATPITRPVYLLGKWLSNLLVLDGMVLILLLAALVMQLIQREDATIHLWALAAPFVFVALPFMALIAALAVFFECIPWLRGSFGNLVYFFLFVIGISFVAIVLGARIPLFDWLGFAVFKESMAAAALAAYPDYQGGITLSMAPASAEIAPFVWNGVAWNARALAPRLFLLGLSLGLLLLGALFFDRFDSAGGRSMPGWRARLGRPAKKAPAGAGDESRVAPDAPVLPAGQPLPRLSALPQRGRRLRVGAAFLAELRLQLKGLAWWWWLVAAGLVGAAFFQPLQILRTLLLPLILLWPLLIWSGLGCREARYNTRQVVFSAPSPLWSQLPLAWLAGFSIAVLMASSTALRFLQAGELVSLVSLLAGLVFIPSLALCLGAWTGSSKPFEVVYVLLWYLGSMNKVLELDYLGIHSLSYWPVYLGLGGLLFVLALAGRQYHLRHG